MAEHRIFYLSRNFGYPLGGVRIAHHHVRMLRRRGFDAAIALTTSETQQFFDVEVPAQELGRIDIRSSDVFVVPEPWQDMLKQLARTPARRLVFCQNHFYMYHGIGNAEDYGAYGVSGVFCCGDVIADYMRRALRLENVPVVHNGIDHSLFRPAAKKRQIAYMPRKLPKEALFIRETFRRLHRDFRDVPWIAIENRPESEVARILGESDVFLSLSHLEGVGLPPIEAMAGGALVAGFLGDGGREYATSENGLWCSAGDWIGCADALARALSMLESDPAAADRQRVAAKETAQRYTLERMEEELVAFWTQELAR